MISLPLNIKNGKIVNKQIFDVLIESLSDGRHKMEIDDFTERSNKQNKYYWKVIVPAVKNGLRHIGWDEIKTNDDAHEFIKDQFFKRTLVNHETGERKDIPGSTGNLTPREFNEFIEAVVKWGAEFLGIQIPFPNEPMFVHYDDKVKATIIE